MSEKYLTIVEASKQFGVTRTHIYGRINAGKIATKEENGTKMVKESDVFDYVNSMTRRKKNKKDKKQKKTSNVSIDGYIETNAKKNAKKKLPVVEALAVIFGGIVGFIIAYFIF